MKENRWVFLLVVGWAIALLVFVLIIVPMIKGMNGTEISDILEGNTEEVDSVWDGRAVELDYYGEADNGSGNFRALNLDDTLFRLGSYSYYPVYVSCGNPIDSVIIFIEGGVVEKTQYGDIDSLKVYSDFSDAPGTDGFESINKAYVVIKRTVDNE
jgi:hypothetical protein